MLQALHVHNFALIEDAKVDFTKGFNIFTGETGAGKSILIDAFGIVLGNRASADYVRSGTDSFWVQAVFDTAGSPKIKELLLKEGIEEDDALFLKRKVSKNGKSQSSINGVQVPLAVLKAFSEGLVDIHGQHENQALLRPTAPQQLVDMYGGAEAAKVYAAYTEAYTAYRTACEALAELENRGDQRERLLDRLEWEIKEIEDANIQPTEEEELQALGKRLASSGKILRAVNDAYKAIDEEEGALSTLAEAKERLEVAVRYDDSLKPIFDSLDSAWIAVDDARQELKSYVEASSFDEEKSSQVQARLDLLYRLQKKYGDGLEQVLAYLEKAKEQYAQLQDLEAHIAKAQGLVRATEAEAGKRAAALTKLRRANSKRLCEGIEGHIKDLAMPNGQFKIAFSTKDTYTPTGVDDMVFMFSGNTGEPLKELVKVASGGELSRVALALKTVMLNVSGVSTMVFDEIDTGVGGVTAQKMAEKIALIAKRNQVLCITHLPQIASFADRHIHIQKASDGNRTATTLQAIEGEERINELMRMTVGDNVSDIARANAKELLAAANRFKAK